MSAHERQRRLNTLRQRVFSGDIQSWMEAQFDWIRRVRGDSETGDESARSDGRTDFESDSHEPTPPV